MNTNNNLLLNRLQQALVEARSRNPRISVRAFSSRLGLPAGTVSLVLLGKRKLSKKTALKFAEALQFDPVESKQLELLYQNTSKKIKSVGPLSPENLRLSADQFHVMRDWYYYAILNLICLPHESHESFSIAKRLGISVVQVEQALTRMERLNLISKDSESRWVRTHRSLKTTEDIENLSLRYSQQQNLELARDALEKVEFSMRDFSSLTLPVSTKTLPRLKANIRNWYQELIQEHVHDPGVDEVYQVQLQVFPLSKKFKKKEV